MDALKSLDMIEQMETDICDMYAYLQGLFSGGDSKDLEIFFYRLYLEESKHVAMVSNIRRKVQARPDHYAHCDISAADFKPVLDQVAVVRGMPRDRVSEIMVQCYVIELTLAEQYAVTSLKTKNGEIRELFEVLGQGFRSHLAALAVRAQDMGADMTKLDMIRRCPRVSFSGKVQINERIRAKCVDISEHGIFLLTPSLFSTGAQLTVSFPLLGGVINTSARVCYSVQNAGMGLSFEKLNENDRAMIREYVECTLQNINMDVPGSAIPIDDKRSGTA
ncbi:MAG TPA: PilZ domain-containing protein [Nitrospirota bacterium]|nr:PilZ domain-containing protein [Nitrospirota bacterium]